MQNHLITTFIKAMLVFVTGTVLVGCASMPPLNDSKFTDMRRDENRVQNNATATDPNYGILIRGFVMHFQPDPNAFVDSAHASTEFFLRDVLTEDGPLLTEYETLHHFVNLDERYEYYLALVGEFVRSGTASPALRIQRGDLVEFLNHKMSWLGIDASVLVALRVVCKGWDEECIAREDRAHRCDDGAMVIDGARRPDRPCGGFGGHSENWAAIVGPLEVLYGSLDEYLRAHNSPFDKCLLHFSCGAEEGNAFKLGKYEEWLETRPNYLPANEASWDYYVAKGDVPPEDRAYMIYMWEEMLSPKPAMAKAEFVSQWRERRAAAE